MKMAVEGAKDLRVAVIGHFAPRAEALGGASSPAGNQVQRQIFAELHELPWVACAEGWVMAPEPSWPRGRLFVRSCEEGSIHFLGFLNLPLVKHLFFSIQLMLALVSSRPQVCVQYNSYFFENLALLLYRVVRRRTALGIIIQDLHIIDVRSPFSLGALRSRWESWSLRSAREFDVIVPISSQIVDEFQLDPARCMVFQGGVTDFAKRLAESEVPGQLGNFGVFAGALERYNGIDRLLQAWTASQMPESLHVFGKGSLQQYVQDAAKRDPRIVFHGFQTDTEILPWLMTARWNFCLRYSEGLNQSYFFPSKLFNILSAPGWPVVNHFVGIPESLRGSLIYVDEDLSNLPTALSSCGTTPAASKVQARRNLLLSQFSWTACVAKLLSRCREVVAGA